MSSHSARPNHALWAGPLLGIFGVVSYFTVFYRWPITRDVPWLNGLLLVGAVVLSVLGLRRAWRRGLVQRGLGVVGMALVLACAAFLPWYALEVSAALPDPERGLAVGAAIPALRLTDHTGQPVDLAEVAAGPVVLVFFRGHW